MEANLITEWLQNYERDSEYAAYFANAQVESAKELLRCGIITELDETGDSNITEVEE